MMKKKIMHFPVCLCCEHGRWVDRLPATRYDPPESGYYMCDILGDEVLEGQEPFGECKILQAYDMGYADGRKSVKGEGAGNVTYDMREEKK